MTALLTLDAVTKIFGARPGALGKLAVDLGFARPAPLARALDGVDLTIHSGEVVGLVGESGCGKSTLGRIAAGLMTPTSGTVRIDGKDPASDPSVHLTAQMVFQDPQASLNPRLRVDKAVGEAPRAHGLVSAADLDAYVSEQFRRAGLDPAFRHRYPHQFSGGQRQRIGIARALAVQPRLLICDEAVAALDVSIQAQIINLFLDLRDELGLTYLFISHDLRVVRHISTRVVIMYLGRIVEEAASAELFARPNHPYTQALLGEIPDIRARKTLYAGLKGEIPSPLSPPSGCHFHPRCPKVMDICRTVRPNLDTIAPGHKSACHLNTQGVPP